MSFDFGMKHIGVAIIEISTRAIQPTGTVKAKNGRPNTDQLDFLVNSWGPTDLIVGLPLNMDSTESRMSKAARRFGKYLEKRFELPVHFVDERLTSVEAAERSDNHDQDHAIAAAVIGETWLHELITNR